jgi:hypothetical protein
MWKEVTAALDDLKKVFADGKVTLLDIPLLISAVMHVIKAYEAATS